MPRWGNSNKIFGPGGGVGRKFFNIASGGNTTVDVPNYNGTGQLWRVHTFTGNANFTVTAASQPFSTLVVGGGGGGGSKWSSSSGGGGGSGGARTFSTASILSTGSLAVTIGGGGGVNTAYEGAPGLSGSQSSLASITAAGGSGGPGGVGGNGGPGALNGGTTYTITGSSVLYGQNGGSGGDNPYGPGPQSGTYGGGGGGAVVGSGGPWWDQASAGRAGVVIIAYQIG
jgi:hypothetical protein